jgi:hypothetical protein
MNKATLSRNSSACIVAVGARSRMRALVCAIWVRRTGGIGSAFVGHFGRDQNARKARIANPRRGRAMPSLHSTKAPRAIRRSRRVFIQRPARSTSTASLAASGAATPCRATNCPCAASKSLIGAGANNCAGSSGVAVIVKNGSLGWLTRVRPSASRVAR